MTRTARFVDMPISDLAQRAPHLLSKLLAFGHLGGSCLFSIIYCLLSDEAVGFCISNKLSDTTHPSSDSVRTTDDGPSTSAAAKCVCNIEKSSSQHGAQVFQRPVHETYNDIYSN